MGFRVQLPVFKYLVMGGVGLGITACDRAANETTMPVESKISAPESRFNLAVEDVRLTHPGADLVEDSPFNLNTTEDAPEINLVFHTPDQVQAPVFPKQ